MNFKINKKSQRKTKFYRNQGVLLAMLAVLLLAVGGTLYYHGQHKNASSSPGSSIQGPTKQEKQETAQHKEEISNTSAPANKPSPADSTPASPTNTPPSSVKTPVSVTISYAGKVNQSTYTINALAQGIVESNGTCTATLTKNSITVTKLVQTVANASSTNCAPIDIASSELSSGQWSLTVTYESAKSKGSTTGVMNVD